MYNMPVCAFVGMMDAEDTNNCIRGNGKTLSMTGYGLLSHLSHRKILSNYYTDFSYKIDSAQNLIRYIQEHPTDDEYTLLITEMKKIIDALGSTSKQVKFVDNFFSQIRKLDADCLYDDQRFKNIHNRVRYHTDVIYIPEKRHKSDLSLCNRDRCKKEHIIYVYRAKPYHENWIRCFDAGIVGKHYNTREVILDSYIQEEDKKTNEVKKNGN